MKNIKIVILLVFGLQLEAVVKSSVDRQDAMAKSFGQTELHMAAGHQSFDDSRIEFVAQLIGEGAAIDSLDNCGHTPLYLAAYYGNAGIARLLIMHGADINHQSNNGETPLHGAIDRNDTKCTELLIEKGANLDLKEKKGGMTPLHYAALGNCPACARLLLNAGANHNLKDRMGKTAGQLVSDNDDEMFAIFIQAGIDNPTPAAAECCTIS